ncbi:N-acetylmuramoyl-L-alanine amidase [Aequorivita sp. H23M31]|uniref:N-acetylmuramoyl-L-alanine amidase n=1 Tax=Aequorivita ciconiae TaxID=2494375 RepID=A0A410G599_9FLAO|nr:N-acetylmuramoyl-L-alanine amidase [Aequorivita sp. H23M31]QAA82447.1 N-acetylmuramoyl-L-alanine amidase [Aequorivita sp. H23M31]
MNKFLRIFGVLILLFSFSQAKAGEKIVVIDIGHGGKDSGFEYNGLLEKDLTLEIAQKIQSLSVDSEIKILFSRDSDDFISLEDRVKYIHSLNPDLVISLHINSDSDERTNGFDIFISPQNSKIEDSKMLALQLQSSLSQEFTVNGVKEVNFYLLKNINNPVVTIEMGYLSNLGNRDLLTSERGQHAIAEAIFNAIK